MSIQVKYFGSTEFPPFEKMVNNMEELKKLPFNKKDVRDSMTDVSLKDKHNSLKGLGWEMSGHVGRPNSVAGFSQGGSPTFVDPDPTKHYFLCERKGIDGVTVRAGATQTVGGDPEARPSFDFNDLTETVVIYAQYKRNEDEWHALAGNAEFLRSAAILPASGEENDYRAIAYITVEGEGTEEEPYKITEIEQAHVGVLREPYKLPPGGNPGEMMMWDDVEKEWVLVLIPLVEGELISWNNTTKKWEVLAGIKGDILYRDTTGWKKLPLGPNRYPLQSKDGLPGYDVLRFP